MKCDEKKIKFKNEKASSNYLWLYGRPPKLEPSKELENTG